MTDLGVCDIFWVLDPLEFVAESVDGVGERARVAAAVVEDEESVHWWWIGSKSESWYTIKC